MISAHTHNQKINLSLFALGLLLPWLVVVFVNVHAQTPTDEELKALEQQIEQQEAEQGESKKRAETEAKRKAEEEAKKQADLEKQRAAEQEKQKAEAAEKSRKENLQSLLDHANEALDANDLEKARTFLAEAEKISPDAHELTAVRARFSYFSKDYVQALQLSEPLANEGIALAQNLLGVLYMEGKGVTQDYNKARLWLDKAASQNFPRAQMNIGRLYHNGWGVPQDYTRAKEWYEKAAAQGNAIAQYYIGWLYQYGQGVSQDYTRAR